jgi:hypothetical protein
MPVTVADMHPEDVPHLTDDAAHLLERKVYKEIDRALSDIRSVQLFNFVNAARRSVLRRSVNAASPQANRALQKLVKTADEVEAYYWWRLAKIEKGLRVEPTAPATKGMF